MAPDQHQLRPGIFWRTWTAPKDGKTDDENEDAARVLEGGANATPSWCVAVADGATEAIYAGLWARTLVSAAAPDWPALDDPGLEARLDEVRSSFSPLDTAGNVPWFARDKYMLRGSQATLLVATMTALPDGESLVVRAVAVGDSCLLIVRSTGEVEPFPVQTAADFGVHPALVRERAQRDLQYHRWEATVQHGDLVLACTDAIAGWCLGCMEAGEGSAVLDSLLDLLGAGTEPAAPRLASAPVGPDDIADAAEVPPTPLADPDAFGRFLQRQRGVQGRLRMRNDDATLVLLVPVRGEASAGAGVALETLQQLRAHGEISVIRCQWPRGSGSPALSMKLA